VAQTRPTEVISRKPYQMQNLIVGKAITGLGAFV
jgi:hypothetical protein